MFKIRTKSYEQLHLLLTVEFWIWKLKVNHHIIDDWNHYSCLVWKNSLFQNLLAIDVG